MVKRSPLPDLVIPEVSVAEFILSEIKQYGDTVAMVDYTGGNSITFREVREQITRCASALYKRGLRKGNVVAICGVNRVEYPIVLLAVAACGGTVTTCNPFYREGEILQQFKLSRPNIVFCEKDAFSRIENITDKLPFLKEVFTFGETGRSVSYDTLVRNDDGGAFPSVPVDAKKDILLLPYSSGTTGLPKGVMISHHNVLAQIIITRVVFRLYPSSCFYMVVPMFHTFGYSITLVNLAGGTKNVFDSRFDVRRMLSAIQYHKVTHTSAVPPIMLQLAQTKLLGKYDTSSLRRMVTSAAPTAPSLTADIEKKYKVIVTPTYGLTEMVRLSMGDPVTKKLYSVGCIVPNTIIKVIDTETGLELGAGEDGEILAKGPQMMIGYLGNPEATARTIDKNGWFHTGDIGHYDEDGFLYIVDRLKELIKYKGFQVAPAELEALLLTHPEITDAAVIGIPDPEAGELPKAFVVKKNPTLSENAVQEYFAAKEIANYKRLRGGIEFVDAIPKSPSGKILRRELRSRPVTRSRI